MVAPRFYIVGRKVRAPQGSVVGNTRRPNIAKGTG